MKIDVITLFPEIFDNFINTSIIKRATQKEKVTITCHNLRDYTPYSHGQVDDMPYGGGQGMVLMVEPVAIALNKLKTSDSYIILTTPQGSVYNQTKALDLSLKKHIIILCGHYEGFDERITSLVDLELSIGDYVLTGGEIPAMAIMDSIIRLIPGVIKESSHLEESFSNNLLDYPVYTKPRVFNEMAVPDVLLSGHHAEIDKWRKQSQIAKTKQIRPDLWRNYHELQDSKR